MSDSSLENLPKGWKSVPSDLGSDQTAFKGSVGKSNDVDIPIERYFYI